IQAFPYKHWREEFLSAKKINITKMEWTLDQWNLYENPLMDSDGRSEVKSLMKDNNVEIPSLTADCFMQEPFFKKEYPAQERLKDLENIVSACSELGITYIVIPLVDNSSINSKEEED